MSERYLTRETPGVLPGETDLAWKLDVGAQCNRVLDLEHKLQLMRNLLDRLHTDINGLNATLRAADASYRRTMLCQRLSQLIADNAQLRESQGGDYAADLRSLVERVATFEELQCAP